MESQLSTTQAQKIRKKLPHGAITKISKSTGLDISTVSKVLNGDFQNIKVIEAALQIIEEGKNASRELEERIKNL